MSLWPVKCLLGFSATHTNLFSERLERHATGMEESFREGYLHLMLGMNGLHDAVEASLAAQPAAAAARLDEGLARLRRCGEQLGSLGEDLVRVRVELFEREGCDPGDPLIARERCFGGLDYERLYRELAAHGAALPQRVFWDDMAARLRDGGARAGLRLLDRHLRELLSDLRAFGGEVGTMRELPPVELAQALHGASRGVAGLVMGFTRLLTSFTYFSLLCEQASLAYQRELEGGTERAAG